MRTLQARKCTVASLDNELASTFVEQHHRQGMVRKASNLRSYGLFYEEELVAVAMFCNPRTKGMQRKYTTELLRLCFKSEVRVRGGGSKLLTYFMRTGAWDFFTYQDSSGERTNIYGLSGMRLVKNATPKQVLIRDGITFAEALPNRRDWFSIEQAVSFGPDALIGTSLGERFREDGTRISNIDLFTDYCGYHLEIIAGDALYDWHNDEIGFYTYRVTSSTIPGYYIGRHSIRSTDPTVEQCLNDGYMGSGGKKFETWVAEAGKGSLVKEVLSIHSTWEEVIEAEHKLIGDSYKTDPLCMNFLPGGTGLGRSISILSKKTCGVHGETLHNGTSCMRCSSSVAWTVQNCDVHGLVSFRGQTCERCKQSGLYSKQKCAKHGLVTFRGKSCVTCSAENAKTIKTCELHGPVLHLGNSCSTCVAQKAISYAVCPIHGETKHQGNVCSTCNSHKSVRALICTIHGETTFQGDTCMKCNASAQLSKKECAVHGSSTFKGNACTRCTADKAVGIKVCSVHGETAHQGTVCTRCNSQGSVTIKTCDVHGETKHQGDKCSRCTAENSVTLGQCSTHGETKFQGGRCSSCSNSSLITVKNCPVHGERKHRGNTCYGCVADRRRAKR